MLKIVVMNTSRGGHIPCESCDFTQGRIV